MALRRARAPHRYSLTPPAPPARPLDAARAAWASLGTFFRLSRVAMDCELPPGRELLYLSRRWGYMLEKHPGAPAAGEREYPEPNANAGTRSPPPAFHMREPSCAKPVNTPVCPRRRPLHRRRRRRYLQHSFRRRRLAAAVLRALSLTGAAGAGHGAAHATLAQRPRLAQRPVAARPLAQRQPAAVGAHGGLASLRPGQQPAARTQPLSSRHTAARSLRR